MSLFSYALNVARAADQLGNAVFAGNSRQTISSRAYEAAVVAKLWYWRPAYYAIDAGAFAIRWVIMRPLGYAWGKDMPVDHCKDAFDSFPEDRTYS